MTEAHCHWDPSEKLYRLFLRSVHRGGRLECAFRGCWMAFHGCGEIQMQSIEEELQESEIECGTTQHHWAEVRWLQEVVWSPETLCFRRRVFP